VEKIDLGPNAYVYPMPVVLVGAMVDGRPNFMTVAWVNRVNSQPPIWAVGLGKRHYTPVGIIANKTFSINFPSADMVAKTDFCGIVSGKRIDKSSVFDVFHGSLRNAPMIRECPLCVELEVVEIIDLPTNNLVLGEVKATYTEERYLSDGKPDIKKMNPLILTMPDNAYWTVGEYAGKAWGEGYKLKGNNGDEAVE